VDDLQIAHVLNRLGFGPRPGDIDRVRALGLATYVEQQLDPDRFVRIHRAYVVNIERIEKIELYAKDSRVAILRDGTRLPVSRSGYARLRELL